MSPPFHLLPAAACSLALRYWNCYPGARVDSDAPIYQIFDKEVYQDFEFRERYPGQAELRRYFDYLEDKLDLRKDMEFNKNLVEATFNEIERKWTLVFEDGYKTKARWFIPCVGFAAKAYVPDEWKVDQFKGEVHHTAVGPSASRWPPLRPADHAAVVAAGQPVVERQAHRRHRHRRVGHPMHAGGRQGSQGIRACPSRGPCGRTLTLRQTLYQRTPNYCCPMNQRKFSEGEMKEWKRSGQFQRAMTETEGTFAGFAYDFVGRKTWDDTPEQRKKFYHQKLVEEGGFGYWLNTYDDLFFDLDANKEVCSLFFSFRPSSPSS